ncbi:MAG: type IV pilus assembly protein PilM [Patescibacteria group bacterium]
MNFFKKKIVGVDIGTDAIKIVEVSNRGGYKKLENYCEVNSSLVSKQPLLSTIEDGSLSSSGMISSALKEILKEARIKTEKAVFSLPDFLTFAAYFEIPPMPEKEMPGAIYYNASRYLTLPITDVTLDWVVVPNESKDSSSQVKIFLIAVPNQVIKEYQKIAKEAGLELLALESEVFGLVRSLAQNNQNTICLIDMGAKTSTINVVDRGFLKRSYSFNFSSDQLSNALAGALNLKVNEAEKIKNNEGILSKRADVVKTLKTFIDQLFWEIKSISADFLTQEKKQVSEFYLTGGNANLPGLKDYFAQNFKESSVYVSNCFSNFSHPKILKKNLIEMSPRFSAAIGVALGILEI